MRALLILAAALFGCLPNPKSVQENRDTFERGALRGSLILDREPEGMRRIGAVFDRAKLLGYKMEPERPSPGQYVEITFYWTAVKTMAEDYQVFVHGDPVGGNAPRIHGDHFPALGKYPTDVWQAGEVVADPFKIFVPPGYGPKKLGIYTGMYKGNYRVPLSEPGERPNAGENRSLAVEIEFGG